MENTTHTTALHVLEAAFSQANTIFEELIAYAETTTDALHVVEQEMFSSMLRLGHALLQHHADVRAKAEPVREVVSEILEASVPQVAEAREQ